MKGISFRTIFILLTFLLSGITEAVAQTYEKTFSFKYSKEDFLVAKDGKGYHIYSDILDYDKGNEENGPALPFIKYWILLPDNYKIIHYTLSHDDIVFNENIVLAPYSLPFPTSSGDGGTGNDNQSSYPLVEYPVRVSSIDEGATDGYRNIRFSINPFTYHADSRKLELATTVNMKIIISPVDKGKEQGHREEFPTYLRNMIYNPEDIGTGLGNWKKSDVELGENDITLHVDGRPLADMLTEGQLLSVKTLRITGSLTDEDYAFIRNNSLPQLQNLDLGKADIETIPAKAFYNYKKIKDEEGCRVTLPEKLTSIGDSAFCQARASVVLTGKFPKKGINSLYSRDGYSITVTPSENNGYCKLYSGENFEKFILSTDGKTLYHSNDNQEDRTVPEGVETIAERAFEGLDCSDYSFPKSLKRIEDYAFYNSTMRMNLESNYPIFTFQSEEPPTLGKEVFSHTKGIGGEYGKGMPTLYIPETWKGTYTEKDEQWKLFLEAIYWTDEPDREEIVLDIINLHVDGQPLADMLTEGQKRSVKILTITGRLAEEDYTFIRNKSLPQLIELNLRDADIETIPAKAFYGYKMDIDHIVRSMILPEKLAFVGDSAFYGARIYLQLTGKFPRRGVNAFVDFYDIFLTDDNDCCKLHYGKNSEEYILSPDGKELYYSKGYGDEAIPEGVEVIAERAFEGRDCSVVSFPESLKRIEDNAFYNCCIYAATASKDPAFTFQSEEPPTLGKEVFSHIKGIGGEYGKGLPTLYVPETWKGTYTEKDEQWKIFTDVRLIGSGEPILPNTPVEPDIILPSTGAVKSQKEQLCSLHQTGSTLTCTAPNAVKLEVYTTEAMKVGETEFTNGTATVKVSKVPATYLYIVTYPDGRRESGKVMVKE